jgi:hypothetical protein
MNISNRERFKAIARFQRPGDLFTWQSVWQETLEKWVEQGAPEQMLARGAETYGNLCFREYFKLDTRVIIDKVKSGYGGAETRDIGHGIRVILDGGPLVPGYESRVIAEDERTTTFITESGQTAKVFKNSSGMPMFLDWPVKDWATWKELKKRLDPDAPGRWPANWDAYVQQLNSKNDPVRLQVGGFYGLPRDWVGSENILYMFYDDPALIEDMMEELLYLEIEVIKRVVKDIKVDEAYFNEDIAYKTGPLISPDMVRRFMVPRYKKITELLRSNGVDIIYLDSDGNLEQLIPLWLESGINFVWP